MLNKTAQLEQCNYAINLQFNQVLCSFQNYTFLRLFKLCNISENFKINCIICFFQQTYALQASQQNEAVLKEQLDNLTEEVSVTKQCYDKVSLKKNNKVQNWPHKIFTQKLSRKKCCFAAFSLHLNKKKRYLKK